MIGSYLGRSLAKHVTLCPCPFGPCHFPHTHTSLACSCQHPAEDFPQLLECVPLRHTAGQRCQGIRSLASTPTLPSRRSPGASLAAPPGALRGTAMQLPTAPGGLTMPLVSATCLPWCLSPLATSPQAFPWNPSQVNTLLLNPGLWGGFRGKTQFATPADPCFSAKTDLR